MMFIEVSGFGEGGVGINLPFYLRNPETNTESVTLVLIRWLTPHPEAILRDARGRPIAPPPFDINHALWTFHKLTRRRLPFANVDRITNLDCFPGSDPHERRLSAEELAYAHYDLVRVESIDTFMNCTSIDNDPSTILETITLPF